MTNEEKLAKTVSLYIERNLKGKTPFQNTSDFISYIAYRESKRKSI
ncbi:hypothetical protein [Nitrosopumilus sp.]